MNPIHPSKRALLLGAVSTFAVACAASPEAPYVPPPSAPWTQPSGPTPVERHGKLRVQGNRIVDAHGEPIMLRGMSLFWSQWMPQFYNAECVRWLRQDWGVNAVRAAIAPYPNGWVDHPEQEMAKARAVIQAAIDIGIYVIVDWHAHGPAPDQATAFFTQIAREYGRYPNVIYEPYNEPLPQHHWDSIVKPFHERVIAAIRAEGADGLVVAGTPSWSQDVDVAAADPLADSNTAYVLHFYAGTHRENLRAKARAAMALGRALMVTEYGTVDSSGDGPIGHAETQLWWAFMEENQISYLNWSVADKEESSAILRPGASPTGGWSDDVITPSGHFVRAQIRARNAAG